jgi:hypothetical protein
MIHAPHHPAPSNRIAISRRGSIYVLTLVTVAAIVSIILIGTILRSATNAQSATIETISRKAPNLNNAAELAMKTVIDDPAWALSAQSGKVYTGLSLGSTAYDALVADADTDATPTDDTTIYRIHILSTTTTTDHATFDIRSTKPDYAKQVKDISAEFYWPLTESAGASRGQELLDNHQAIYADTTISGTAYNDEGAPVPSFDNDPNQIAVPWNNTFRQSEGSLSCWIKFTGPTSDFRFYPFLGMKYSSGGGPTINIALFNAAVWAYTSDDNAFSLSKVANSSFNAITKNTWHHITVTWGSNGLKVYVDGARVAHNASNRDGIDTANFLFGGNQPMLIGSGYDMGSASTPAAGFYGSVAHVAFYDHDLDDDEIAELAQVRPDERTSTLVQGSWTYLFDQ